MSLLTPAACRSALVTAVAAVVDPGKVYAYRRITVNEGQIRDVLYDGTRINGWFVSFAPAQAALSDRKPGFAGIGVQGGGEVLTTFAFAIDGYYGLDDVNDSAEAFETLAWSICQRINSYGGLAIDGLVLQGPCQLAQCSYAMLAGKVLTHYARLTITMMGRTQ